MTVAPESAPPSIGSLLTPRPPGRTVSASSAVKTPEMDILSDDPLVRVLSATNPLLEAARPLLRALAEIPVVPLSQTGGNAGAGELDALRQALIRDMHQFQQTCDRAGFRREQVVAAKYCLCTALDEAVNRRIGSGGDWAANSLLLLFHNETSGGEKFFLLLGHMVQSPGEHAQVLEVLYHILSLGFEGRYALSMDGHRQLETIHRRLLAVLSEHTPPPPQGLSPHWRGVSGGRMRLMRSVPVWVTACVLGMLLLALFLARKGELTPKAEALNTQVSKLAETPAFSDVPVWRDELPMEQWFSAEEQQRYGLSVDASKQTLRLPGNITFSNGVELRKEASPVLHILAARLKDSRKTALIIGHTDNTPLRSGSVFRDNQHLSEARAQTVMRELIRRGVPAERLKALGKSDTVPLVDNVTPEGRLRNRRVEISLHPEVR